MLLMHVPVDTSEPMEALLGVLLIFTTDEMLAGFQIFNALTSRSTKNEIWGDFIVYFVFTDGLSHRMR